MSAPAISPAPSPAAGPAAANVVGGAQSAQATGALAGFEAMLATLYGVKDAAGGAAASAGGAAAGSKTGGKPTTGAKAAADGTKADAQDKTATGDAGATLAAPDANLAVMAPVTPVPLAATSPAGTSADDAANPGAAQPVTGATADKTVNLAAGALAQLAPAPAVPGDGTTQTVAAPVAGSAESAATNAAASAKIEAALTPKTDATQGQAAQAQVPAPQGPAARPNDLPAAPATISDAPATVAAAATDATATAAAAPPPAGAPTATGASKDKGAAPKAAARVDGAKVEGAAGATAALTAKAASALQTIADTAPQGGLDADHDQAPALDAKTETAGSPQAPPDPATSATTTPASLIHAATVAVRGAPQTVANLAAQIVRKLDGRSTQFDVQLDPIGLGKVDVRIAIGADGRMSAAMSFDTPQAAAELKSRSAELQRAMEQAGFDMSGGMSFDVTSDRGQGGQAQQQQAETGAVFRGRAFQAALDTTADAPPPQLTLRRSAMAGVDIRI